MSIENQDKNIGATVADRTTDLVVEARELLAGVPAPPTRVSIIRHALFAEVVERERESPFWGYTTQTAELYARAPELLSALSDEVEALRKYCNQMPGTRRGGAQGIAHASDLALVNKPDTKDGE